MRPFSPVRGKKKWRIAVSTIRTLESSQGLAEVLSIAQAPTWTNARATTSTALAVLPQPAGQANSFAALRMEFVAIPAAAQSLRDSIPSEMEAAFRSVTGFAGCLVLVSVEEARLVTVITLWSGVERRKYCSENARWMKGLLSPYVDRWLRTQTLTTSIRAAQMFTGWAAR
jgi:hypothetical protein